MLLLLLLMLMLETLTGAGQTDLTIRTGVTIEFSLHVGVEQVSESLNYQVTGERAVLIFRCLPTCISCHGLYVKIPI